MAGRKRDAALDAAILHEAALVLGEDGYAGFAIEAVAQRLGIPKSTIYSRWRSRSALVAHLLSQRVAAMSEIHAHHGRSLREALVASMGEEIALSRTREGRAIAQALLAAHDRGGPEPDPLIAAMSRRRANYRVLLQRAIEQGELESEVDLDLVLELLLGAVWASMLWAEPHDESDAARLVDVVLAAASRR